MHQTPIWPDPTAHIIRTQPDKAMLVLLPGGAEGHGDTLPAWL